MTLSKQTRSDTVPVVSVLPVVPVLCNTHIYNEMRELKMHLIDCRD